MKTEWKPVPIPPFDRIYSVSNTGLVRRDTPSPYSHSDSPLLCPCINQKGHHQVNLYANGVQKCAAIHRLVALAFLGEPPPGKTLALHKDDDKSNNHVSNLYWGDHKLNARDRSRNGHGQIGERHHRAKLTENDVLAIRKRYDVDGVKQQDIAEEFGVTQSLVSAIILRKNWAHV